jgi:FtsH-binding integral membrane protein
MLLIGAIVVTLVNLLLYLIAPNFATVVDMILNYVILAIFVGLTAYDMQKIKAYALESGAFGYGEAALAQQKVVATYGALSLYLDFINIFIRILSIFGRKK